MKKSFLFLLSGLFAASLSAITLEEKGNNYVVVNPFYTVEFAKNQAYRANFLKFGKKPVRNAIFGESMIYMNGEHDKYTGNYAAADSLAGFSAAKSSAKVLSSSESQVELEFDTQFIGGTISQKVTMDDSSLIRYQVTVKNTARLSNYQYAIRMNPLSDKTGVFYPDQKRIQGKWMASGDFVNGVSWKYAWYEKSRYGMGVIATPGKYLGGIQYGMQNTREGWGFDTGSVNLVCTPLQNYGVNHTFNFDFYVIAGGSPEQAEDSAEKILGKKERISLFSYETEKLTVRPGQGNKLFAEIQNDTANSADVTAKTFVVYGLDSESKVAETSVSVNAGERKVLEIPVEFPADAERGVALRTELYDGSGTLLDQKTEYCSITDFAPRDTGFGIINAGQAYQEGSYESWNRPFKKNYVGGYEYYCWAPSTIYGLAPKEDQWLPGTEAGYNRPISKKFVKGLVDDAHSRGVGVYTWITGLWNYEVAIKHPEMLQYCENGQPNIYNGGMRSKNQRRMTIKPNIFTVERAAAWGEEMADSVDMFGWDGCRWDFSFLPSESNDPLYIGDSVGFWYDHKGVPNTTLYPEPDKTGTECLKAWRAAVEKRHPNYIYGTNMGVRPDSRKNFPNYIKTAATRGLLLFEDMLNYSREKWCTFEKWGDELAFRTDYVRPNEAAPVVGAMRGLPANSVSYHLANYTCASAGVKWWAGSGRNVGERSEERNRYLLRYARYYFGCDFLRPANMPVKLEHSSNILYKPFVRERQTADGREIVIPMVNMPDNNDYICVYHQPPQVRKNVSFKVDLKPGETAEAWGMNPQNPEKAVKLQVKDGIVTVPELVDAGMVLIQCR